MELEKLLDILAKDNVSDIILAAGARPRVRSNGEFLEKQDLETVAAADIDAFRLQIAGEKREVQYHKNEGLDLSIPLPGNRRCRINFFTTIHGPGMAVRPLRDGSLVTVENQGLPEILKKFASDARCSLR